MDEKDQQLHALREQINAADDKLNLLAQFAADDDMDGICEVLDIEQDCPHCRGYGELPGDPHTKRFPVCSECEGSGKATR